MKFRAIIELAGKTATGIEVPAAVVAKLGSSKKPAVRVTIKGYTYRSTVATVNGSATAPVPFTYADRVGSAPAVTWRPGTQRDGPPPPVAPSAHPARPTGSAGVLGQIMAALRYWLGSPVTGSSRSDARFGLRVVR